MHVSYTSEHLPSSTFASVARRTGRCHLHKQNRSQVSTSGTVCRRCRPTQTLPPIPTQPNPTQTKSTQYYLIDPTRPDTTKSLQVYWKGYIPTHPTTHQPTTHPPRLCHSTPTQHHPTKHYNITVDLLGRLNNPLTHSPTHQGFATQPQSIPNLQNHHRSIGEGTVCPGRRVSSIKKIHRFLCLYHLRIRHTEACSLVFVVCGRDGNTTGFDVARFGVIVRV